MAPLADTPTLSTSGHLWLGERRNEPIAEAPASVTTGYLGVNGLKFRDGTVYASNLDLGTLLRIPVHSDGTHITVLTERDGLSNPTSALVTEGKLYVPSAAYVTQADPNLLVATITSQ